MSNVVLFSMLYPETRVIGTNDLSNFRSWFYSNALEPYNIGKIKHVTGDVFVATVSRGTSGSVWITYNAGHKFEKVLSCGTPSALARGQDGMLFLTAGGTVYRSQNGKNWYSVSGAPNIQNYACCMGGLIFGHDGTRVYRSRNNGLLPWETVYDWRSSGNTGIPSNAIAANSTGSKVMISSGPVLKFSTTQGDSWTQKTSWDNWNVPRELHYLNGSTWLLKMRHIAEDLGSIQITNNDGGSWTKKFNQYVIHDHQIEYLRNLGLIICGHTRYAVPGVPSIPHYVPSIMVSRNMGSSFTEYVFEDQERFFSVLAISGTSGVSEYYDKKKSYNVDVLLRKMRVKPFSANLSLKAKPTKSIDANVVLQKDRALAFDMNALIKKQRGTPLSVNALLKKTLSSGYGMDVITVQRLHKNYVANMLIQNTHKRVIDIDALFRKNIMKGYGMRLFITDSHFDNIKTEMARSVPQAFNIDSPPICHKLLADIQIERGERNE